MQTTHARQKLDRARQLKRMLQKVEKRQEVSEALLELASRENRAAEARDASTSLTNLKVLRETADVYSHN